MMDILLLEDDIALQNSIKLFLEEKGFFVDGFYDGEDVIDAIDKKSYDLYLLDVNVPNVNGLEMLKLIKNYDNSAKVIMISANNDIETIKQAYSLGSIDYLKKPFYIDELFYKINLLTYKKRDVFTKNLAKKERQLFELLYENMEHIVSYEEIEEKIYKDTVMTQDSLRALVKRLRKKIQDYEIKNISGVGYLLRAETSE